MIGQKKLLRHIDNLVETGHMPYFNIFVGERGSETTQMASYIADKMAAMYIKLADVKIETIREMIVNAYRIHDKVIYNIPDADNMSTQAKNALLKVTEEPPNNAYFVMCLEDLNNSLDTIKSRAAVFIMERYTPDEISFYANEIYKDDNPLYRKLCSTPGEVDIMYRFGIENLYNYVQKVHGNIATVSGSNAFKISDMVALKDEEDKYDLKLFWKSFVDICHPSDYGAIKATSDALKKLGIKGVNKQMLFDNWILEVRKAWM